MRNVLCAAGLAAVLLSALPAAAASLEEVVVTSSKIYETGSHIFITKRADHLITTVRVTCDTRDANQRKEELKNTVRNMIDAARASKTISLGSDDDTGLSDLDEANLDDLIVADTRPDTSQIRIVIKTEVSTTDTFKSATARVHAFIDKTVKLGRTEILPTDRWDLTIIGPEQYRDTLIAQIVADAKHTADLFGPGYAITVDGLEQPVSWRQTGPLDLALYITYALHIALAK